MTESVKSILVTGASSGIGGAIARRLAKEGYEAVVHFGKNLDGAKETCHAIAAAGGRARMISFDVSDADLCRHSLEADMAEHGAYYGVVCNAGCSHDAAFPALSQDDWRKVIDVNLNSFYNVLHPLVMPMIKRRLPGRIVTISSVSGLIGNRGQVNYSAAKSGIIGATKALALELAKRQITVNCVAPGVIVSEMSEHLPVEQLIEAIPLQRFGEPEEVAALVAFLCSAEAAYITRQVISINGGLL